MSEQPDLSTLPKRMRWAADVLEDASARGRQSPRTIPYTWEASDLIAYAEIFEAEDTDAADARIWALARELLAAFAVAPDCSEIARKSSRVAAEVLINSGWRKADPE